MKLSMKEEKLHKLSRVAPSGSPIRIDGIDSVGYAKRMQGKNRVFDVMLQAQQCWLSMEQFRKDRERNKNYTYGKQWDDIICINGRRMREEDYIRSQGNLPLKNNLIRRQVEVIVSIFRGQAKEPTCIARDRNEQKDGEVLSTLLQYNMDLNQMGEINARSLEEFLISGFVVHRKWAGWKGKEYDCWTEYVQPNNFFIDPNMRDFRGLDVTCLGEIHDISFEDLCERFAKTPSDYGNLSEIYKFAKDRNSLGYIYNSFGYPLQGDQIDFFVPNDITRCRVIEVWRKETKPRYRCHDLNTGDIFKIEEEDFEEFVGSVNRNRLIKAKEVGIPEEEVPLIKYEWFVDSYWYYYYLTPFGDILDEGESPYWHSSHPYVFKAYPYIDGEIHSFVADLIDQQRYVNRLITMYDWIMRASAKGVLLFPEDALPDGYSMDDIADEWARFDGIIMFKSKPGQALPQQVANNCTNIGIHELLQIQLKLFEDIYGVNGAIQGKPGYSGMSAALYSQQTQNAQTSMQDILEAFSAFVREGSAKDVSNIQQYYDGPRMVEISGESIDYNPAKVRNVKVDIRITDSTSTPVFRALQNDMLMKLVEMNRITVEQMLENGSFPFADKLLQSLRVQKEQLQQGQIPEGVSPDLVSQTQHGANMNAVAQAQQMLGR